MNFEVAVEGDTQDFSLCGSPICGRRVPFCGLWAETEICSSTCVISLWVSSNRSSALPPLAAHCDVVVHRAGMRSVTQEDADR